MNLAAVDLNLLVALDALLAEGSVSRAAVRMRLSQPAMSHILRRLRLLIGDPLLVRAGGTMELTPRALALKQPLAEALEQVRGLLEPSDFHPRTSERRFEIMVPDHVFDILLPPLASRLAAAAPSVARDVRPWRGRAFMASPAAQALDLIVACVGDDFAGFHRERLFSDTDVLAIRLGHPGRNALDELPGFPQARHVGVVGHGQTEDPVDTWLRDEGVRRTIAVTAPTYLQALHMVSRSDVVAVVPGRLAQALSGPLRLEILPTPLDPGTFDEFVFHPSRAHSDPASKWLRQQVRAVGRQLAETPPRLESAA